MAKAIHMMIRVLDEARSVAFYKTAFGLDVAGRFEFESFTLVYMSNDEAGFELELTINHGTTQAYELGNGYGHLAFCVEDLDACHQQLSEAGFEPRKKVAFDRDGQPFARFFFVKDPDGYEIEVLQRLGRFH
ncbi:MAG: VOC family protein [Mangrovicoccus sp.]